MLDHTNSKTAIKMSTTTTKKPRPKLCKVCKPKSINYWCIPCNRERFQQEFSLWTSGNKHIDNFIQTAQIEATRYEHVIEWIPFDRFENVEFIAEGGFGKVYKAKWKDGRIKASNPYKQLGWFREPPSVVALKSLNNSKDIGKGFLDELKSHLRCIRNAGDTISMIPLYGITQNTSEERNYMMVTLFADKGSMRDFMKVNLSEFVWSDILLYLSNISKGLLHIHNSGLIHRDFHSGNILFEGHLEYIADFGLSKPADSDPNDDKVYGILPYVAPELLGRKRGKAYTQASDIYSFGILMWELVTCVLPYKDESYIGEDLAFQIRNGRRPEIDDDEFPECYAQLMKECWSENPDDRPKAEEVHNKIAEFQIGYAGYDFLENYNPIYKDIFTKAQVKRKKFLEQVYKIENNIDLAENEKKDLDDHDNKNLSKRVDRYFSPPHPEAYTKSRLVSSLNNYRRSNVEEVKEEISEVTKTLESITLDSASSGLIDIPFDDF